MTWLKLDDGFMDHPKIEALSDRAFRLHVAGMAYSARVLSDGFVPDDRVKRLIPRVTARMVAELITGGCWEQAAAGYQIHDYLDFNPTRATVLDERDKAAERKTRWKDKKNADRNASRNASGNGAPTRPGPKGRGSESGFTSELDDEAVPSDGSSDDLSMAEGASRWRGLRAVLNEEAS